MEYRNVNDIRMNYASVFNSIIAPKLICLENERQKTAFIVTLLYLLIVLAAVLSLLFLLLLIHIKYIIFFPVIFIVCNLAAEKLKTEFTNKIKTIAIPALLQTIGTLKWQHGTTFRTEDIASSELCSYEAEQMTSGDNISGKYLNSDIQMSEVFLYKRTRNRNTIIYFDGIFVEINCLTRLQSDVILKKRRIINKAPMPEVKIGDSAFEKQYYVASYSAEEAQKAVRPALIKCINSIKNAFNSNTVEMYFQLVDKIFMAIDNCSGLFSDFKNIYIPLTDTKQYSKLLKKIISILKIVDYVNDVL